MMGSFKQQWLTWIIISAAAACVSSQGLITSTLREGNGTCPGEEIIFNCTLRGSLILAWSSPGYIEDGNPLQFSAGSMLGVDEPSRIDGRITATATLTRNTMDNGEQVLESTLRITAVQTSMVTCSGTSGDTESIKFFFLAVPGVPQRINAREISRPVDTLCIILVTWSPPANSDPFDIDQYIVYVPSRNIRDVLSSTLSTLTVSNCGDDIRIQVAAMNRDGCEGMNSSEVQPVLIDIPIAPTDNGSATLTTTEGGSTPTSIPLTPGAIIGIVVGGLLLIACIILLLLLICIYMYITGKKKKSADESHELHASPTHKRPQKDNFISAIVYDLDVLKGALADKWARNIQIAARALNRKLNRNEYDDNCIKEALIDFFGEPEKDNADDMKNAIDSLNRLITDMDDNTFKDMMQCLKTGAGNKDGYDRLLEQLKVAEPTTTAKEFLKILCEKLNDKERYKLQSNLPGFLHQSHQSLDTASQFSEDYQIGPPFRFGSLRRSTQPTALIKNERVETLNPGGYSPRLGASSNSNLANGNFRKASQPTDQTPVQLEHVGAILHPGRHSPPLGTSSGRNPVKAKECYRIQSKYEIQELGTEEDRVSVPIWMDDKLDGGWKASLRKAMQSINEAAPGLSLSIAEDKKQAIIYVLAIHEKDAYTEGNIQMRSSPGQKDYITIIHLGKSKDDTKDEICTRGLFHALGFNLDHNLGLTGFDPLSIILETTYMYDSAQTTYPGDPVWRLKKHSTKEKLNTSLRLSELDKVGLNLVYRPCRDTTANNTRYRPKLGKTGMYYCGRRVMSGRTCTYPGDSYSDSFCGPDDGPNCPACRTIKSRKVKEIQTREKWQGMTGLVYCGRLFAEPGKMSEHHDGICGIDNGPACPDCKDLLNKEI